jgi:hypothetical protein
MIPATDSERRRQADESYDGPKLRTKLDTAAPKVGKSGSSITLKGGCDEEGFCYGFVSGRNQHNVRFFSGQDDHHLQRRQSSKF